MGFICTTLLDLADRTRRLEGIQQQTLDEVREMKAKLESVEKFSSSGANDARVVINKVLTPNLKPIQYHPYVLSLFDNTCT